MIVVLSGVPGVPGGEDNSRAEGMTPASGEYAVLAVLGGSEAPEGP
jgi:hypothetical protein